MDIQKLYPSAEDLVRARMQGSVRTGAPQGGAGKEAGR